MSGPTKMCIYHLYLSNELSSAPNNDCIKNLRHLEVGIPTNPIRAHKYFGVSYPRVRFFLWFPH
jgi:hypothetical protein